MEILFRAIPFDEDDFVFGYFIKESDGNSYIHWTDDEGVKKAKKVKPGTVGLYTGEKDKKRNKIFNSIK